MNRRSTLTILALAVSCLAGCGSDKPRSLVVADGSGTVHAPAVDARVKVFQSRTGRPVRVLAVPPAQAVLLASRGEADVAVVPAGTSLDGFLAGEHGRVAGLFATGGEQLRILEVDARQHPKVDAKGARDLAAALITPP